MSASPTFDLTEFQQPALIQRMLFNARTIAIIGLSANPLRASHFVGFYLQRHGYRIIPVNPREPLILGERSYARLSDVPERIDIVNVFRAPDALPDIVQDTMAIGAPSLWCQFNVIHEAAARTATQAGLAVVMDRCIKIEHARYAGRMHWLGLNTQTISSVRRALE